MNQHSHQTAPMQFVQSDGIRFAYRRFGKAGGVPIVLNQHNTGTMDYWDPTVTDGLARDLLRRRAIRPPRRFCRTPSGNALGPAASDYFLGYAIWNYLTAPFLFAWPASAPKSSIRKSKAG